MKMISKLSSDKENVPPARPSNQRNTCCYCYSRGSQTSHPSEKYTSKWKLASHEDEVTFKNMMGVYNRKCNIPAVRKLLN